MKAFLDKLGTWLAPSENLAIVAGVLWTVGAQQGWLPPTIHLDLSGANMPPMDLSPSWCFSYAFVRIVAKLRNPNLTPFAPQTTTKESPSA